MAHAGCSMLLDVPQNGVRMFRVLRLLIVMPLLGAVIAACGSGTVAVTPAGDPSGTSSSSGSSTSSSGSSGSSSSSSGSSSSSSSSGGGTTSGGPSTTDVLTYHNDNMRTGQYLTETVLTPA